jgi:hypothetical protein
MPYEVQGPTPIIPALAGLASAYFQIKNENQKLKQEQAYQGQEMSASKTNQAATRQQYGLGPDDKPTPLPWDTGPSSPAGSGAAAGAAFEASQGAGGLPSGAPQAGIPSPSPSAPSGSPNYTDPAYLKSQLDTWTQRYAMTRPGTYPNTLASTEVGEYSKLLDNVGKGDLVPVKMPGGQMGYVPFSTAYTQNREDVRSDKTHPMIAVPGPDGKPMMVPTSAEYGKTTVPASTVYTQGKEDTRQQRGFAHSDQQMANRQQFETHLRSMPTGDAIWNHSAKQPEDMVKAVQAQQHSDSQYQAAGLAALRSSSAAATKAGSTDPAPHLSDFTFTLNKYVSQVQAKPETEASIVKAVTGAGALSENEKSLMIDSVHRAAATARAMKIAQGALQKANAPFTATPVPSGSNPPGWAPGPPPSLP